SISPDIAPETLELDPPQSAEVLIDVAACGVCHTDLHVIKQEVEFPRPAVLGHEVAGVVADVGAEVDHVQVGDRVAAAFIMPCGSCRHCKVGLEAICEVFFQNNRLQGLLLDGTTRLHQQNGTDVAMYSMAGHSTRAVVPASAIFKLPQDVNLQDAAILGCSIFTSYGAVFETGQVAEGETVAVVAAGGRGLSITHLSAAACASRFFRLDLADDKLLLAKKLVATDVINSNEQDAFEVTTKVQGHGFNKVFEPLRTLSTVQQVVSPADDRATVVWPGTAPPGHN